MLSWSDQAIPGFDTRTMPLLDAWHVWGTWQGRRGDRLGGFAVFVVRQFLSGVRRFAIGGIGSLYLPVRLPGASRVAAILELLSGNSAQETNAPNKIKTVSTRRSIKDHLTLPRRLGLYAAS